ncbi:MAG: universal stress protein [Desulfobacterales bacterium]
MKHTQGYDRILCATDLSSNADDAFEHAARIAHLSGESRVTMIHALEKIPPNAELYIASLLGYSSMRELRSKDRKEIMQAVRSCIERFCEKVIAQIPQCAVIVDKVIIEEGSPGDLIPDWAIKIGADLVVLGASGHSALLGPRMGSTTRKVVKKCTKPVLVIPSKGE